MNNKYKYGIAFLVVFLLAGLFFFTSDDKEPPQDRIVDNTKNTEIVSGENKNQEREMISSNVFAPMEEDKKREEEEYDPSIVEEKYVQLAGLFNIDGPTDTRKLMKEIQRMKFPAKVFDFLMDKYNHTSNETEKAQIESIISFTDYGEDIDGLVKEALETQEVALFISIMSALETSDNQKSKMALLDLMEDNLLSVTSSGRSGNAPQEQGVDAINDFFIRVATVQDAPWMKKYIEDGASDIQILAIARGLDRHATEESMDTLRTAEQYVQDEKIKEIVTKIRIRHEGFKSTRPRPEPR